MKKLSILLVTLLALWVNAFSQNFEGILVMDMTAQGMNITQEYKIKGDKALAELKMGGIPMQKMYMNGEKKEMYMLMEKDQKIAMKLKLDDTKNDDKKQPKVTVTKETKDILGYKCTKIIVEDDKKSTTAWVTKDLNLDFSKIAGGGKKGGNNAVLSKHGFPLELEGKDEQGTVTMKATKIEKTSIDNSVFPDLSQYQVQEMPSMMGK
jgi:hypothetical protein